jgi:membrane associated rhomboid family serine protease
MKKILTITNFLILANIIMFAIQNIVENGILIYGLNIYLLKYDLWYQFLSSMFVHGGVAHILMNMVVLFQFGEQLEQSIGKIRYLILYFIGGVLTSIASFIYMLYSGNWANLVGASGAICVLIGFIALRDKQNRKGLITWVLLISFAPLILGLPVAWYSHIFGFVFGWIFGYLL